jgi:hypothetical protein
MSATIRGKDVLEGSLTLPLRGVWVADLDVNATSLATGAASLSYVVNGAATTFQGTIVESSPFGGRVKVRLVGGAGKMSNELPALGYGQVPASTIVRDVVVAASEALADGVADELRDTLLPSWHRAKGSGTRALTDLAEHLGVGFRMLANGTVWLGKETWTQAKAPFEIHGPDANGLAVYGPVRPDLVPGTNLAGKRVSAVEFSFSGSLRANVTLLKDASGNSDRAKKAQSAFVKQHLPEYERKDLYEARVIAQRSDGTLDLKCDNPLIGDAPGTPIYHGIPGCSVKVAVNARVKVGFDSASPTGRFCGLWKTDAEALELTVTCPKVTIVADEVYLGAGEGRTLREGDLVMLPVGAAGTPTPMPLMYAPSVVDAGPPGAGHSVVKT